MVINDMDTNKDGEISKMEFMRGMRIFSLTEYSESFIFDNIDVNKDGRVTAEDIIFYFDKSMQRID